MRALIFIAIASVLTIGWMQFQLEGLSRRIESAEEARKALPERIVARYAQDPGAALLELAALGGPEGLPVAKLLYERAPAVVDRLRVIEVAGSFGTPEAREWLSGIAAKPEAPPLGQLAARLLARWPDEAEAKRAATATPPLPGAR